MRITMDMMFNNYNSNLNDSFNLLNKTYQCAMDYRTFEKPSDDPFKAAQAFHIRRELDQNADYQSNLSTVKNAFTTAESTLGIVGNILKNASSTDALGGITGTKNLSDRNTIADKVDKMKEALVTDLNQKYGNQYLFAGAASGADKAPFSVVNDQLYYRGINVDTGENLNGASTTINYTANSEPKTMQIDFGKDIGKQLNGYSIKIVSDTTASDISTSISGQEITVTVTGTTTKSDLQSYLRDSSSATGFGTVLKDQGIISDANNVNGITLSGLPDNGNDIVQTGSSAEAITDIVDLDSLANEKVYVDIGLGLRTDSDGNVVDQTAFNSAISGLKAVGYGMTTDKDGNTVPNNAYSLLTKFTSMLRDENLNSPDLVEQTEPYMKALTKAHENIVAARSDVGSRETFLTNTKNYLESVNTNLSDRDDEVEIVDMLDAYTDYSYQYYCYQAALKVGSTVLQSTLMDYMS